MSRSRNPGLGVVWLGIVLGVWACDASGAGDLDVFGDEDAPANVSAWNATPRQQAINEFLRQVGKVEVSAPAKGTVPCDTGHPCPPAYYSAAGNHCTYEYHEDVASLGETAVFAPNSEELWVGNFVNLKQATETGNLEPFSFKDDRRSFMISASFSKAGSAAGSKVSAEVTDPSIDSFRDARNGLLQKQDMITLAAASNYTFAEVYSDSQVSLAVGANVEWAGGSSLSGDFSYEKASDSHSIVVKFTQVYYTIDVADQSDPAFWFADEIEVGDLQRKLCRDEAPAADCQDPDGTIDPALYHVPAYVASLTYGRNIFFSMVCSHSTETVKAAFDAKYKSVLASGSASVTADQKAALDSCTIKSYVFGGDAASQGAAVSGADGLGAYMAQAVAPANGVVLSYKLKYLTGSAPALLQLTSKYAMPTCSTAMASTTVHVKQLWFSGGDGGGDDEYEIYGHAGFWSNSGLASELYHYLWGSSDKYGEDDPLEYLFTEGSDATENCRDIDYTKTMDLDLSTKVWLDCAFWEYDSSSGDESFGSGGVAVALVDVFNAGGSIEKRVDISSDQAARCTFSVAVTPK